MNCDFERLRAWKLAVERKQEIELLRPMRDPIIELRDAKREVELLQQAIGLITTLKPDMQMDPDHPLDMMQEVYKHVTQEIERLKDDERRSLDRIERDRHRVDECRELREALQEVDRWLGAKNTMDGVVWGYHLTRAIHKLVKDALLNGEGGGE